MNARKLFGGVTALRAGLMLVILAPGCGRNQEAPPATATSQPATQSVPESLPMGGAKSVTKFFVTSKGSGKGGDLGGLTGADAHCQALANAQGAGDHLWQAY